MVLEHALQDSPQVNRRFEIATFVEVGRPQAGPVCDDPSTLQCAAREHGDRGGAVVRPIRSIDARGSTELGDDCDYCLAPGGGHGLLGRGHSLVEPRSAASCPPAAPSLMC